MLEWPGLTAGTGRAVEENQAALQEHLQVWPLPSDLCWGPDLGVPRSSQSPRPVTALPKLELICRIRVPLPTVAERDAESLQSAGSKRARDAGTLLGVAQR